MRPSRLLYALVLLGGVSSSQNLVANGDFRAGLTGWTLAGGHSLNPQVESFDVSGLGPSPCFACSPGGQSGLPPYAPNTLEQSVSLLPTVTYELIADATSKCESPTTANFDAGLIRVDVNGTPVGSYAFTTTSSGSIQPQAVWRAKLCMRFVAPTAGAQPLTFNFSRGFLSAASTPRVRITNLALRLAANQPSFCVADNLRLNRKIGLRVQGAANAPYAVFVAPNALPSGLQIPGVFGLFHLDPLTTLTFLTGALDATGDANTTVPVPPDLSLTTSPLWFQPVHIATGQGRLGTHHYFVFTSD